MAVLSTCDDRGRRPRWRDRRAIHGQFIIRDQGKRGTQRARPIKEKESYRWLEGADQAAKVSAAARHITVIADRESDIYEAFTRRPANVDLVVHAAKDRSFGKDQPSLFAMADALPVAANLAFTLPAKPGRKERDTQLALRFSPVTFAPVAAVIVQQLVHARDGAPPGAALLILLDNIGGSGAQLIALAFSWRSSLPNKRFAAPDAPLHHWYGQVVLDGRNPFACTGEVTTV
ncbi:hypothetical protein [Rhizobium grahamii]|uniref:hypothetical protein n=1 Tax=Rhizobium grahamii TaxID=1120045 RepID=UPI0002F68801|nr:hypothetical protein [Rhizobium grahamii]